ncbi:hypothetical protein MPTK1_3g09560 [Marchantia polymorpha subsp. ruderalis]|uniref:Zinc-ribbon 15 domain-containing protein n=2 Tax=Marchantia polymorpha TaxID=3197 RepID=A0AAF6AZ31_MARPO|nr:hypothetical protein MARPO_0085s0071 [Marchantia polymorpha]BBN05015.1 hypothetical protein Mp_3g09560 [Marchantia polymorpha subsp. ruderalis]|eukprot:PTQ33861.1 hypothetical protein MARPO_0085s0071 [Marchantia polymorpha]
MFFFFGGVQPEVTKILEYNAAVCPRCGQDANLVDYDHVFRAFFIPVWRWAGSNPAVSCGSCSFLLPLEQFQKLHHRGSRETRSKIAQDFGPTAPLPPLPRCWSCSRILEPEFRFCPQCGAGQ